ncbi:MAG: hypothetical protein AAGF55_01060 [Pseudomonadota bacterium]
MSRAKDVFSSDEVVLTSVRVSSESAKKMIEALLSHQSDILVADPNAVRALETAISDDRDE